jgi:hypothetical protein
VVNPGLLADLSLPIIRWLFDGPDEIEAVMSEG